MPRFELETLASYDNQSLIDELRRVSKLTPHGDLTRKAYDRLGKADSSTVYKHFGSWHNALAAAGLEHRFNRSNEAWTREEIIERLKSIARDLNRPYITTSDVERLGIALRPIRRLFGSFKSAVTAAGLSQSHSATRYTDEECYENLLAIWTLFGRQPSCAEIDRPPSKVGSGAYKGRWGSWRKALEAFIRQMDRESTPPITSNDPIISSEIEVSRSRKPRDIPRGLRYTILKRDRFRCVACGRSPATHPHINLHVDHIKAWSLGGANTLENLRSLCNDCNLGKGSREE